MQATATRTGRLARLGQCWRTSSLRWRVAWLVLLAALMGLALFQSYQWLTTWPARLVLENPDAQVPVSFTRDGSTLATCSNKTETITLWDPADGRKKASWTCPLGRKRFYGTFSLDGKTFACAAHSGTGKKTLTIELIEVATGETRATVDSPLIGSLGQIFLEDGQTFRLLATDGSLREVVDVDLPSGKLKQSRRLSCPLPAGNFAVSADGQLMAHAPFAFVPGAAATVWDLDLDREVGKVTVLAAGGAISAIEFSPDRQTLAIAREEGAIELWDWQRQTLRSTLHGHRHGYFSIRMRFSPDGSKLASMALFRGRALSLDILRVQWARLTGDRAHQTLSETIVLDTLTGRRLGRSTQEGVVNPFSPDGKTMATSHEDGNVRLRDVSSLR